MFSQHVSKDLSAYCHGELADESSRLVAEHLIGCQRCRREFEEIKLGVKLAEQLPSVSAPASLWNDVERALAQQGFRSPANAKVRDRRASFGWKPVAAFAAAVLAIGAVWFFAARPGSTPQVADKSGQPNIQTPIDQTKASQNPVAPATASSSPAVIPAGKPLESGPAIRTAGASWDVARLEGSPKVGSNRLDGNGKLAVGEWLETDASSRAQISVANIGHVNIEPNSRVKLVGTNSTEHRLSMTEGRLHAMISAPPRLFIVETPSALAVDLGCSYTLEVDKIGRSILHVTSGWVALEVKGRESIVPAGAVCATQPGKGPGTPYFENASARFRGALTQLDFQNGGAKALGVVLAEAREYDTLTLWHLLSRTRGPDRERVFDRMALLSAPPSGVTRDGVLRLDKGMLNRWKDGLETTWFE